MTVRLAVFASGGGTNLQALLDHFSDPARGVRIAVVVSDRPDAGALGRSTAAGVPGAVVPVSGRTEAEVAADTMNVLGEAGADLVALAGYLRLVPSPVVNHFAGRIVNVHPALLPAFGGQGMYGARVHRAVLEAGARLSGPTIHLVDERYDEGLILAQWPVPVLPGDTAEALAARVLRAEHALYPATVEWLAAVVSGAGEAAEDAVATALKQRTVRGSAFSWMDGENADGSGIRRMLGLD